MTPLSSLRDYDRFVCTLQGRYPSITRSALVVVQRGRLYAKLRGELSFQEENRLVVLERPSWDAGPLTLEGKRSEAWHGGEKLCWYDSQPHPDDPTLASPHPHHKHLSPEIKHPKFQPLT